MPEVGSCARPSLPRCRQFRPLSRSSCCSFAIAPSAPAQDSSLFPLPQSSCIHAAVSRGATSSFAGYEGALKAAIDANDLKSQALALDRIGALYFTHRNPVEALKYFHTRALNRAQDSRRTG